jgi:peroxiredoxin
VTPRFSRLLALLTLVVSLGCGGTNAAKQSDPANASTAAADDPDADLSGRRGTPLESFTLKSVDGKAFDIAPLIGSDVLMVTFWATWCSPCKAELTRMAKVYDLLQPEGFEYIAIATDDPSTVSQVRPYVTSYGYRFPVLLDTQSTVLQRYNPRGDMPFYLLVNRRGEIVEQHQGFNVGDEILLEKKIRSLLGEAR